VFRVKGTLERLEGVTIELAEASYEPMSTIRLGKKARGAAMELVSALEELPFVVAVSHNIEQPRGSGGGEEGGEEGAVEWKTTGGGGVNDVAAAAAAA